MRTADLSRRQFVARSLLAAASLSCALGRSRAADDAPNRRSIDVHHHFLPPGYIEPAREYIARTSPAMQGVFGGSWSPARSLEEMDRHDVEAAIVSISAPGVSFGDAASAVRLSRLANEYAAGMKRDHPPRFGFFASLPLPDIDRSLQEVAYALDELHADGIGLMTSYVDRWPGHSSFAPLFEELNRRKAIVYFHPTTAACCGSLQPELHAGFLEFPFDSTRAIASLLYSGTLTRCPDIRFIFSHGGGALGAVHSRLLAQAAQPAMAGRFPQGPLHELQKLYYDVASVTNRASFSALTALIPHTQLLLGTDFPLGPPMHIGLAELAQLDLAPSLLGQIERGNALQLFTGF
jgi:predicted TIM-barrel fold metal-dependent hydrolase